LKILHVVGARPNFMKAAPVMRACARHEKLSQVLVHTGQHYDVNMSDVFFRDLGIADPDVNLQVGSGSHAQQTAAIMSRFEGIVLEHKPDMVLVYGDVNSTVACALVCAKLLVPVAHVEAGLRSNDRTMPEEINRILTDQLSDLLFTPSADGNQNLHREGIPADRICFVGNVMIDTLVHLLPKAKALIPPDLPLRYVLVTMHRPANVDDCTFLCQFLKVLCNIAVELPVVFPVHPRTRQRIADFGLERHLTANLRLTPPLSYLEFLGLQTRAAVVVTDSGGVQEETTFLGIPCLTVRESTERPVTVKIGTNVLVGRNMNRLREELHRVLMQESKPAELPLWDGHAADRIASVLLNWTN
jgi:UDP-N-acetylglucosamine 2-epimerase (non-hydrolysing)